MKLLEFGIHRTASGNHDDIVTGQEFVLIEAVNFPQSAADPIAGHGTAQLFADGDAHPIFGGMIFSGIQNQKPVSGLLAVPVKSVEDVIEFERFGKFHTSLRCSKKPGQARIVQSGNLR